MSERLAKEVRAFLESQDALLPAILDDDTPLISSGALDSLALLNLAQWIEERLQRPLDVSTLDVRSAWDSINSIVGFIELGGVDGGSSASVPDLPAPSDLPGGLRILTYRPELAGHVAQFQTGLWTSNLKLNLAYLQWKYLENPYGRSPTLYILFEGDRPLAMRGFYPARWEAGARGQTTDILVADDFLIRESHRNQGLARILMEYAVADLARHGQDWILNLSGGLVTVVGSLAMGWRSAGPLGPVARLSPMHPVRVSFRNRLPGLPYLWRFADSPRLRTRLERAPFRRLDRVLGAEQVVGGHRIRVDADARPEAMAALVDCLPYDGRIRHVRDATYLSWRYRNPRNQYRFLYAEGNRLRGYLVLGFTPHALQPDPRVMIVDWEAEDRNTLAALLDAAIRLGRFPSFRTWSTATPAPDLLEARGFRPVDQHLTRHGCPCILVQSTQPGQPPEAWRIQDRPLLGMENWDMRMLFSMVG